jgi:hypothetical protein
MQLLFGEGGLELLKIILPRDLEANVLDTWRFRLTKNEAMMTTFLDAAKEDSILSALGLMKPNQINIESASPLQIKHAVLDMT